MVESISRPMSLYVYAVYIYIERERYGNFYFVHMSDVGGYEALKTALVSRAS